jgi:uncharacterized protein YicC (UPF0701 family)
MNPLLQKFIAFLDSTSLSDSDKNYFIACYSREGPSAELEAQLKSKLARLPGFDSDSKIEDESDAPSDNITNAPDPQILMEQIESKREEEIRQLDEKFAPQFAEMEQQMNALQNKYDETLEEIQKQYDEKIENISKK